MTLQFHFFVITQHPSTRDAELPEPEVLIITYPDPDIPDDRSAGNHANISACHQSSCV
jgi:hypothetical protein